MSMRHTFSVHRNHVTSLWDVKRLWELTKDLPTIDWEIPSGFTDQWSWGEDSPSDHVQRCIDSDLAYPILVWDGKIIDGCHRTIKALALGHKTVSAKIIDVMPEPDEEQKEGPDFGEPLERVEPYTFKDVVALLGTAQSQ